ncbi:MAG: hypothetical protein ABF242_10955 [Flavobacteriales bacterium]
MKNLKMSLFAIIVPYLAVSLLLSNCKKEDDNTAECTKNPSAETDSRTNLPFGGPLVLRRDLGDTSPLLGYLWLCGLPSNGAGNADASDWTNTDGSWDYTRKPQVDGNVTWLSNFQVRLDGSGNRIITGNALPDHPTGVFPIDPSSVAYQYDRNPNIIDSHVSGHSGLMGYMMDGFGIFGPRGEDGSILTSADLDECHGHTHPVMWDGVMVNIYHYHWTYDFPYTIGCFKGTKLY